MPLVQTYMTPGYGKQFRCTFCAETTANSNGFDTEDPAPWVAGQSRINLDDSATVSDTANLPTHTGGAFYKILLSAAEMSAFKVSVAIQQAGLARAVFLRIIIDPVPNALTRGTLAGGSASGFTLPTTDFDNVTVSVIDNFYINAQITIIGGTGANQTRPIASYTGASRDGTVARDWATAPDGTSIYVIAPGADVWDQMEGSEPTGPIADNGTFRHILQYLKRRFTNRVTQTANAQTWYKDDSATTLGNKTATSDGVTQDLGKLS